MFSVLTRQRRAKIDDSSSKLMQSVKHVDPSLLRDKLVTQRARRFVKAAPLTRLPVLGLVIYASKQLKSGASVLDVGAGDCPYKDIFANHVYKSTDFAKTGYHRFSEIDYICPAEAIPVSEKSFDAILCTEVLEHVPDPGSVLVEFNRILKSEGSLFLTTPLINQLHEEPYDFYRYTPYSFRNILKEAGFEIVFITPKAGWIASVSNALREMPLQPPKNLKGLLFYCFLFLPIFSIPMAAVRWLPFQLFASLDKALDKSQKYTAGFAVHALKIRDL